MKRYPPGSILASVLVLALLMGCATSPVGASSPSSLTYDFEGGIGSAWSTVSTFLIQNNKILGLFNDKNDNYRRGTRLTINNIPPDTTVNLSFDLYLIGSWDSDGKLADRWTVTTQDNHVVMELTEFPCVYRDSEETIPVGNTGFVRVGSRAKMPYWVVHKEAAIGPDLQRGRSLVLEFRGYLTGKSTEFWGLDNVHVRLSPRI